MSTFEVLEAYVSLRRKIALLLSGTLKDSELSHSQIRILYRLTLSKANMGELAEHTLTDKAAVTRTVAGLEKLGLVKRSHDEDDRRVVHIELTGKGKVKARKTHEIREAIGKTLDRCLNAGERRQFSALAEKIVSSLNLEDLS